MHIVHIVVAQLIHDGDGQYLVQVGSFVVSGSRQLVVVVVEVIIL